MDNFYNHKRLNRLLNKLLQMTYRIQDIALRDISVIFTSNKVTPPPTYTAEIIADIMSAISRLDKPERYVIFQRYFKWVHISDIAKKHDKSERTVYRILYNAKDKMVKFLRGK